MATIQEFYPFVPSDVKILSEYEVVGDVPAMCGTRSNYKDVCWSTA